MIKTLNKRVFYVALATLIPAFMFKDSFPDIEERDYALMAAPLQGHARV